MPATVALPATPEAPMWAAEPDAEALLHRGVTPSHAMSPDRTQRRGNTYDRTCGDLATPAFTTCRHGLKPIA